MKKEDFLNNFYDSNVLFLQGPIGDFFGELSNLLENEAKCQTWLINFNAGDRYYNPKINSIDWCGDNESLPSFLNKVITDKKIEKIIVFGDNRIHHTIAKGIAIEKGIDFFVFEEGYIRPNFITFEKFGVNGFSKMKKSKFRYIDFNSGVSHSEGQLGSTFYSMAWKSFKYYSLNIFFNEDFQKYVHHRPINKEEFFKWALSFIKKPLFKIKDCISQIEYYNYDEFFLAPLQVHNDKQVTIHSKFNNVEEFIDEVLISFSEHSNKNQALVFKHHPLDKAYTNYRKFIKNRSKELNIGKRVFYILDGNLPKLITDSQGVIIINSTVGISSIHHNKPTICLGESIFDFDGLTNKIPLDRFWTRRIKPDQELFLRFKDFLMFTNQINGNFYKKFKDNSKHIKWD